MCSGFNNKKFLWGFLVAPAVMAGFFLYSYIMGRSDPSLVGDFCSQRPCQCGDWDRELVGAYQIENNVWNKKAGDEYQQCVYFSDTGGGIEGGWAWNWPGARQNVAAYPNIMLGKNPWLDTTSPDFPRLIDTIECLEIKFDLKEERSGRGNLAFDLWITDDPASTPGDITHEVMIWLSHQGQQSAGSRIERLTIDNKDLTLYRKEDHNPSDQNGWTYLAFVYSEEFTRGSIDLSDFLDYLVEGNYLSGDEYLSSIQLGSEIISGSGQVLVREYQTGFCDK